MSPITKTRTPRSNEWATPKWLFDHFDKKYGPFTLDAAAQAWNAKCARFNDGVKPDIPWAGEVVWLNPPYTDLRSWMARAYRESPVARMVFCLVPNAPDCYWWSESVEDKASEIIPLTRSLLPTGRVHFEKEDGWTGRAGFSSAAVIYRPGGPIVDVNDIPYKPMPRKTVMRGTLDWISDAVLDGTRLRPALGTAPDAPQHCGMCWPSLCNAGNAAACARLLAELLTKTHGSSGHQQ